MIRKSIAILGMLILVSGVSYAAAETYDVDPIHSFVIFETGHLGVSRVFGRFDNFSGTVVMDKQNPANSSVAMTLDPGSVDTGNEARDKHLSGPDFFNSKQFASWTFKSTSVKANKDGSYTITGEMTAHGQTRTISFPIRPIGEGTDPKGAYRAGWKGEFTLNRSDYGINYMVEGTGDEVVMTVALEGIRR